MPATISNIRIFAVFLIVSNLSTKSENITYDGPLGYKATDYFKQELSNVDTSTFPELSCESFDNSYWYTIFNEDYNTSFPVNYYTDYTSSDELVKYYIMTIDSSMKSSYTTSLSISTCCDIDSCAYTDESKKEACNEEYQELILLDNGWNATNTTDKTPINNYCSQNSTTALDTVLYILQSKKDKINVIYEQDDSSCTNTQKSYIDLSDYAEGDYIVAVGGYGTETGNYWLHLDCVKYLFPIEENQFDIPSTVEEVTCGSTMTGKVNETIVDYYKFSITSTTYFPITINNGTDWYRSNEYLYIIKASADTGSDYEILESGWGYLYIYEYDEDSYPKGDYYIVIQAPYSQEEYNMSITCAPPPTMDPTSDPTPAPTTAPKIETNVMIALVFGSMGCLMFLLCVYYLYELCQYHRNKKYRQKSTGNGVKLVYEAPTAVQLGAISSGGNVENKYFLMENQANEPTADMEPSEPKPAPKIERVRSKGAGMSIRGVDVKRLDKDKSLIDQIEEDEDVIQACLAHAIDCCNENEEFDIYQVLAIRWHHEASRQVTGKKLLGIPFEIVKLSPFVTTLFVAIIVGLTQTWGTLIVVEKLIAAYFEDGLDSVECDMTEERWKQVVTLKFLALLLSLVVTFFIGFLLDAVKHNGLYEMMDTLSVKHLKRVPHLAIFFVQLGQFVNYWVGLMSILGSYFIIFASNQGDENPDGTTDYSSVGLDMILNAVALFFLLELDDMLVSDDDYEVCAEHLQWVLENYDPDPSINHDYMDEDEKNKAEEEYTPKKSRSGTMSAGMDKMCGCMVPFMYYIIAFFGIFVTVCCYVGGFFAPFVIFFCW